MARQVRRISELPEATALTGDELLEIVQDGDNKRVRADNLPGGGGGAVQSVQGRTGDVVITADDVGLGSADNTSDADKPVSTAQLAALDGKVDKAAGMGLSSNDFTDPLRDKLIGLEGTHWRGTFVSLAALQAGVTDPEAGDYADVDNVGDDVVRYIWDATDGVWVAQSGEVAPITASQVKLLYESNPDTNAFTDAEKGKLGSIQSGAQVNTVTSVNGRTGAVAGLVEDTDSRLSDAREWTAATVSQAEAEAGTASTRRAWTAQRVRQAINAWWQLVTSGFGRNFIAASNEQAARNVLQLGTAATRDVGTDSGNVMEVGAGGLLTNIDLSEMGLSIKTFIFSVNATIKAPIPLPEHCTDFIAFINTSGTSISTGSTYYVRKIGGVWSSELVAGVVIHNNVAGVVIDNGVPCITNAHVSTYSHSCSVLFGSVSSTATSSNVLGGLAKSIAVGNNILTTTGQSTQYPMTQKAVTDAINARGFADASGILTVTSGALSNDMSAFLSLKTKAEIVAWLAD